MNNLPDFNTFEDKIGIQFNNKDILRRAFTHRSFLNENRGAQWNHNERLEFLGDAVLELVTTKYLFDEYPDRPEGELTAIRAALVNTDSIAEGAGRWDMNDYLLLSKGEAKDTGRARQFILANTFEAVIGAIYLDQGYDSAREFVGKSLFDKTEAIVEDELWQDPKSRFQEKAQEEVNITPTYELIEESGPDHDKHFTVGIYLNDEEVARGEGKSKQEAEREAAENALEEKKWE